MGVFDSVGITVLANQDPGTDNSLPPGRLLNYGAINSDTGIRQPAGAEGGDSTGTDVKVVHGIRKEFVMGGPANVHVVGDVTVKINGNETRTVLQNFNETVNGTFTETVTGLYTLICNGGWYEEQHQGVNRLYFQNVSETYSASHHSEGGDDFMAVVPTDNKMVWGEQINYVGIFQLNVVVGICATIAAAFDVEYKGWHAELHICHGELKPLTLALKLAEAEGTAASAEAKTQVSARASCNAGVDVDCGFPPT